MGSFDLDDFTFNNSKKILPERFPFNNKDQLTVRALTIHT